MTEHAGSCLPGLRGLDHIGFTVPDIEAATDFFVNVIGCEVIYHLGPISADDDWMSSRLGVDDRAEIRKIRFLRCGHGSNFELFEYAIKDQNTQPPRNSDVGGHHLAFYVDDFDTALAYLKSKGLRIMGEPTIRDAGPSAGVTWVYFLTPWGMQCELVSFPEGKAYEQSTDKRLWEPRFPER